MDSLVPYYSDSDSSPELCSEDHDQPPTKSARLEELITASSPPLVLSSSDGESDDPSLERSQTNSSADEGDFPDPSEIPPQLCVKTKAYAIKFTELSGEMQIFLKAVDKFFTRAVNLERQTPPLKNSTYSKAQERMLGFLGFLHANLRIQLTPEVFLRSSVLEKYLDYLQAVRKCSPATVANHASSLLYPVKFLHREHAPNYHNIPVIRQIRTQATILQREGDLQRPKSKEELTAANRWLEWEEIVQACSLQRDYFEMAVNGSEKARECCNLVVLAMYVFIPPSRGLEIRTLQIERDWKNFTPEKSKGKNLVLLQESSQVTLHFDNYKTHKHYGHEQIFLKGDTELCKILVEYVNKHRPKLLNENSGQTLLLNRNGEAFSSSSFSSHIKQLFHKLTGTLVTINMLRSAFVSWAYGRGDCTDALKTSLASALRHSRDQAERIYDRRTSNQRKEQALSVTMGFAEESLSDKQPATSSQDTDSQEREFEIGQFVGLVEEGSRLNKPLILIGQIQSFMEDGKVSLLWYTSRKSLYSLDLDGSQWFEDKACLTHVTMQPARNKPGYFRLATSLRAIHKTLSDE